MNVFYYTLKLLLLTNFLLLSHSVVGNNDNPIQGINIQSQTNDPDEEPEGIDGTGLTLPFSNDMIEKKLSPEAAENEWKLLISISKIKLSSTLDQYTINDTSSLKSITSMFIDTSEKERKMFIDDLQQGITNANVQWSYYFAISKAYREIGDKTTQKHYLELSIKSALSEKSSIGIIRTMNYKCLMDFLITEDMTEAEICFHSAINSITATDISLESKMLLNVLIYNHELIKSNEDFK